MIARLSKYVRIALFLVGFVMLSIQLFPGTAVAAKTDYCDDTRNIGGRAECNGYFTNINGYFGGNKTYYAGLYPGDVITGGLNAGYDKGGAHHTVTNVDEFVEFYSVKLNGGGSDAWGSAFVILTMLGVSGPNAGGSTAAGIQKAKDVFSEWETMVRAYTTTPGYSVNFNGSYDAPSGYANSGRLNYKKKSNNSYVSMGDVAYHKKDAENNIPVVVFTNPSGVVARIQRTCSNMIGSIDVSMKVIKATCVPNSSGMPSILTVGQAYYFKPQVDLSSAWGAPMSLLNPKMHYTISHSSNGGVTWPTVPGYDNDISYDAGFPTAGKRLTANPTSTQGDRGIVFIPNASGLYKISWSLTGTGVEQSIDSGTCGPDQGKAGTQPYFSIIGGDIIAGGKVNGYNQNGFNINADADATAYAGAGTNLAAIVGGTSTNFVTGVALNTGVSTKSGAGLGFSNASLGTNETAKGFIPLPSIPTVDLSGAHTNWAAVGNLSTCTAKCIYDVAPGTTISGTVSAGADITLYAATGNIYLGNITYNYSSLDNIPRLTVYTASGNIIVANTTNELHGVFIAAGGTPADTSKGRFYSCGTGANSPITYTTVTNQCGTALTVYGAVIADKLVLARTPGTFIPGQPNSNPAEKFVFGPEIWLHRSTTTTSGGSAAPVFDQYFSLPPVL